MSSSSADPFKTPLPTEAPMKNVLQPRRFGTLWLIALTAISGASALADDIPADLAVSGSKVATVHAKGVQIYVCKSKDGKLAWELKAPDATFTGTDSAGKAIEGKHFKGPTWETTDGSSVVGKMLRKHNATVAADIPWLLIEATDHKGTGVLATVKFIQRLNT